MNSRNFNSKAPKAMVPAVANIAVVDGQAKLVFAIQFVDPKSGEVKTVTLTTGAKTAVDQSKIGENFKISDRQVKKSETESFEYLASNIAPTNYNIPLFFDVDGKPEQFEGLTCSFMLMLHGKPISGAYNTELSKALANMEI